MIAPKDPVLVGRLVAPFGIKGWLKVQSFTEQSSDLLSYQPWWFKVNNTWQCLDVDDARETAKGWQCHVKGVDTPELARTLCKQGIWVEKALFPDLPDDEYYWHQLEGLQVLNTFEGKTSILGSVASMHATGANDVLVVKGDASQGAIDNKERWLPYIDQVVQRVDCENGQIEVSWDPDF